MRRKIHRGKVQGGAAGLLVAAVLLAPTLTATAPAQAATAQAAPVAAASVGVAATRSTPAAARAAAGTPPDDAKAWAILKTEDGYVLRYGVPHDGNPPFSATCQPAAGLLQFTVEVNSRKVRAGDGVPLTFTAGTRRLELAAATFRGADRGLVAGAAVTLDGRALDLFSAGETLHVALPGLSEHIPLAGAQAKLADFKRVCLATRRSEYHQNSF